MEAVVRAKFTVVEVTQYEHGLGKTIKLQPRYDSSLPEDKRFSEASPSGEMSMYVTNPHALEHLTPGAVFYLDFIPAPAGTSPLHA
jgi:hypothetical protein